jgi:hypothetical protein
MAIDWEAYKKKAKKIDAENYQKNIADNDIAPARTSVGASGKATSSSDIAPIRSTVGTMSTNKTTNKKKSLFDDGYDFGDITKTILGSREKKEQKTSAFDDAMHKKYSTMSYDQIEKEYKRVKDAEKTFKDENGGKLYNYLAKTGSYLAEGKSGQSGSVTRSKSQANIDKINDLTREKEILNIYRKQRATEAFLTDLNAEQLQLLDNISEADALENMTPVVSAAGGDSAMFYATTSNQRNIGKSSREKLFAQLKKKNPEKSDSELNETIDNMVELRRNQVNAKEQEIRDKAMQDYASENAVAAAILSRGANIIGGVTGLSELYLQRDNEYGYDTNAAGFMLTKDSNVIDEKVKLDHDWTIEVGGSEVDAFDFIYDAGTGVVDNLGRLAMSGGNSYVAGAMMFSQGVTQSVIEGKEKGYSDAKALTFGLLNGTFEAIAEKLELDVILGKGGKALRKLAKSFVAEGGEELVSNWLNRIADEVANGKHSELSKEYGKYVSEGYTKAQALAEVICSVVGEDFESFLIGGISGLVMGGGVEGARAVSNKTSTKSERRTVDAFVNEKVSEKTREQAIEEALKDEIAKREKAQGGELTDRNKKALRETIEAEFESGKRKVETTLSKEEIAAIKKEVKGELKNGKVDLSKLEELLAPEETKQINELTESLESIKDEQKKAEIQGKIKQLEGAKAEILKTQARENKYLAKAAYEKVLSLQKYEYDGDISKITDEYERAAIESAVRILNNTTEAKKYGGIIAKLAKDKQTRYILTNNQELLEQGDLVERANISAEDRAKIKALEEQLAKAETEQDKKKLQAQIIALKYADVGGLVRKNVDGVETVLINADSRQAMYTVLGHETKHVLEKYNLNKDFNELLFKYAEAKGDLSAVRDRITDAYKSQEKVDIEGEIAAELTGKYLFEDQKFLDALLKQKSDSKVQEVINKIKELIDDLVVRFKGTEQEKQLREVQKKFTELYNSTDANIVNEVTEGTKYALNQNVKQNLQNEADYGEAVENNDMETAQKLVDEVAEEAMPNSVIRDGNGKLLTVYHGSPSKFTVFDHSKMNVNGNAHGRGFYFTEEKSLAEGYQKNGGQLLKGYLNITNPMSEEKITIKKSDLVKLIQATCEEEAENMVADEGYDSVQDALPDTWISGYVYTYGMNLDDAYKKVADILYSNDNDVEIIAEMTNVTDTEIVLTKAYEVLGVDGVIYTNERGTHEYVSLVSNQFKSAEPVTYDDDGNVIPLSQRFDESKKDVRYSLSDIDGKPIDTARITKDEFDTKYSLSHNPEIAKGQSNYLANHKSPITVDELDEAQAITNAMVDVMMKHSNILPEDKIGKVLTKNGSYDRSVENTTICVRTLAYNEFVDKVQEEIGRPLTQMESFLVSQKLYDIATEPQCLYCYVSLDRKAFNDMLLRYMQERDTVIAKYNKSDKSADAIDKLYEEFLNGRKNTPNMRSRFNDWIKYADNGTQLLSLADISTEDRQSVIKANGGILAEQLKDARKYAQSASWSKIQKNYVAYRDEILKLGDRVVKNLNEHYGMRWYSFSDYSAAFIVENMQQITDASIRGLKGLSYTKDTDYAEIFAPSGMNINISVFVNTDANGNFFIDEKQSANFEKALELRKKYPNVGIVATVTNDEALRWAGEQEWSDVIIPFHIVRTGMDVAEYYKWLNYTSESADKVGDADLWNTYLDSLNLKSENARKKVSKNIYPNEHKNDKATYLALCENRGLSPRFVRFAGEDWYMKLVNETRLSADESSALKPKYDLEAAQRSFAKFVDKGGYEGGWYKDGVDVDAEVKVVADDVLAGKKANEVDYGRQDGFAPEDIIAGRKTNRTHKKNSLANQDESFDYSKSLQSIRYNDGLPIRDEIWKKANTDLPIRNDIAEKESDVANTELEEYPITRVKTNRGYIPIAEYRDIMAMQNGYDDYADMRKHGVRFGDEYDDDYVPSAPTREKASKQDWQDYREMFDGEKTTTTTASAKPNDIAPSGEEIAKKSQILPDDTPIRKDIAPAKESKTTEPKPMSQQMARILTEEPKVKQKNNVWSKFKTNFIDKASPFETLSLKTGNREVDAKFNSIRYADSKAQNLIGNGAEGVKALNDIQAEVEQNGHTMALYEYLYHKHNISRMTLEDRFEGMTNKPVFGDNVTADASKRIVKRYEALNPKLIEYANDIYGYNKHLRNLLVEGGVISQETADLWEEMYPYYVPTRRVDSTGLNVNVPLDSGKTGINAPIKRAKGGNTDILPLFDTMAQRTLQTYKAIAKNKFGIELKNTLGTTIENNETSLDEVIGSIESQDDLLQKGKDGKNPTFTVFENGEKVTFEITEEMYDAMKPTSEGLAKTIKPLNVVSKATKGVLTEYNPTFMLTNAIKDAQDVMINSQHPVKTYKNFPKAVKELATKGDWYKEYMENGGADNTYFDKQTNTFNKEKNILEKIIGFPFDKISYANNFIERIPRLAEYIASREKGRSIDVAMLDAARVTTNFAAGGDVTKFFNRNGATFLNASVQGAAQQVRNVREAKAQGLKGWVQLATKVAFAGLPITVLNALLWDDDEEYEELSDYVKENYYVVCKTQDGKFIRIPKGRAMAVIQNAFGQVWDAATGDDEIDLERFLELAVSNLAPNNPIDNNIIAPIMQVKENRTWYGDDLVPSRLQDLPEAEQYDESTDDISKWLGEKINVSPYKINYLLNQYSGGLGDLVLPPLTPKVESSGSFITAPLRDKFVTDGVLNNQNPTDFYEVRDELKVNANSMNATDEDKLKNKYFNSISSEVGELYKEKREIQNSDLSDELKYKQVREIQKQINETTKNALETYEDVTVNGKYATIGDKHYRLNDDGEWQKISDDELEKQNEVIGILGITPSQYWGDKAEYDMEAFYPEKHAILQQEGISAKEYNEKYKKGYFNFTDEYHNMAQNPGRYVAAKAITDDFDEYIRITDELNEFRADKDSNGKPINGTKKKKIVNYINNLDIDYGAKCLLIKTYYKDDNSYNGVIFDYLQNRDDISREEMIAILESVGATVDEEGYVDW